MVNEHFGTTFMQEDDKDTALTVGQTLPSWNAYEKIELPINRVAVRVNNDNLYYIFGVLDNGVFTMNVVAGGNSWICDENGKILNSSGPPQSAASYIIGRFANYSIVVTEVRTNEVSFDIGQDVPDWDKYTKYGG